ncbi:MAG TPA: hypothetical protein VF234_02190 [Limnochordia bacterium]
MGGRTDAVPAYVLAVDPGRLKCGIAVMDAEDRIRLKEVVPNDAVLARLLAYAERFAPAMVVLGDRTGSRGWRARIERALGERVIGLALVDEHLSTVEARRRYLAEHPPRGWRRLIPPPFRVPDRPVDDYVAVILAERYRRRRRHGPPEGPSR